MFSGCPCITTWDSSAVSCSRSTWAGRIRCSRRPTFCRNQFAGCKYAVANAGTISGGPNFAYDLCVEKVTAEQKATLDLSRWALAFNGAEPVRAETIDRFSEAFAECGFRREAFYPCYGLAEATLIVTGGFKQSPPTSVRLISAGLEQNHVVETNPERKARDYWSAAAAICSISKSSLPIRKPLRIWAIAGSVKFGSRVPSVAGGYWKRDDLSREVFQARLQDGRGPFLRTGDLGFLARRRVVRHRSTQRLDHHPWGQSLPAGH